MKAFLEEAQQDRLRGKEKGTAIAVRDPSDTDDSPDGGEAPDFLEVISKPLGEVFQGPRTPVLWSFGEARWGPEWVLK